MEVVNSAIFGDVPPQDALLLQIHRLQAYTRQVFIPLAAGIATDADTSKNDAIFHDHQASLAMCEIGISQLADASPLTVQALRMGTRIYAHNSRRVCLGARDGD